MNKPSILIIEDNLLVGTTVQDILVDHGYDAKLVENGKSATKLLSKNSFNIVILDMMLPDTDGRKLLKKWRHDYPELGIIMMTAYGDIGSAVECLKAGADDFLTKPVEKALLLKTIDKTADQLSLSRQVKVLTQLTKREIRAESAGAIIGDSPMIKQTLDMAELISASDFSCLFIKGESGTGKGLFAKTLHSMGKRADKPFVDVNCSALPATLIESELFGHKKGSFTDAKEDKIGLFELADGGTLFLDEIGDMEVALQVKLLKAIEEQKFRRIGSTADVTVDVCIIAATNQDVEKLVTTGKFRMDLFYRLNVIPLEIPPLRERREDVDLLADHFIGIFSRKFGKDIKGFTEDARESMAAYPWPGNVREFRNVVERGCILATGNQIGRRELMIPDLNDRQLAEHATSIDSLPAMPLAKAELLVIKAAMKQAKGNKNKAARILGVHRTTLYKKLEEYAITAENTSE